MTVALLNTIEFYRELNMHPIKVPHTFKSDQTIEENRKDGRIPYIHPLSYKVIGQFLHISSEVAFQGTILNISGGGVRIRINTQPCQQEMMIRAWIPLPQRSFTVPVIAVMRWVKDENNEEVYDIGFEFVL